MSILAISNHNSFQVLFDKIASVYFFSKLYSYFSTGNGHPREPALCQLCRHTFISYSTAYILSNGVTRVLGVRGQKQ